MKRTQNWVNRMVQEGHCEVTWETGSTVEVRWNHNNHRTMVWVV